METTITSLLPPSLPHTDHTFENYVKMWVCLYLTPKYFLNCASNTNTHTSAKENYISCLPFSTANIVGVVKWEMRERECVCVYVCVC